MSLSQPLSARKGLCNDSGANNCFLNVVIQSLWHVRSFRVLIARGDHAAHHRCSGDVFAARGKERPPAHVASVVLPCLLCELEQVFVLYQFAEQSVLDVDRVRLALGDTFALGAMNDATETLETILDALHHDTFNRMLALRRRGAHRNGSISDVHRVADMSESLRQDAASIICEPQCVAHRLFQMNLMELKVCTVCGHTAEPGMNTDFLYRVYAQELLNSARAGSVGEKQKKVTLEEALHVVAQTQDVAGTCDVCERGGPRALSRWILTLPMVFSISIIWSSSHVHKTDIKDWMELLSSQCAASNRDAEAQQALDLGRIFRLDNSTEVSSTYSFRGLVCYYGRHYVGFFASRSLDENGRECERWFLFDDTRVKLVGTWADVRLRIERGGYQPTLLFYERNGIEQEYLEKISTEIHSWWAASANESDDAVMHEEKDSAGKVKMIGKGAPHEVDLGRDTEDELLARMEQSVRMAQGSPLTLLTPAGPGKLPTSPISLPFQVPKSMPVHTESKTDDGWRDEDVHLHMAHKSARDTLSRLNGMLCKNQGPASTPVDGRAALRMAMSQSMQRSIRLRDYSVRRPAEKEVDVNRDKIFEDATPCIKELRDTPPQPGSIKLVSTTCDEAATQVSQAPVKVFDVCLHASDGGIGLLLDKSTRNGSHSASTAPDTKAAFTVSGFEVNGVGSKLPAEASGAIDKGDILVGINGHVLENEELFDVLEMLLMSSNPIRLQFNRMQQWACPRCTLVNERMVATCLVCGHTPTL
ncbi:unnamed protein product [Hyaloperonospora brassicae]|uniref:USP domain-containing protein n=1 Tax=Hyaloperonospora brassicae TaxID=162125 RepID=A0AAV0UHX3_HYABA|nr:unnamed protein product [Hyaloperonospora brassicae]